MGGTAGGVDPSVACKDGKQIHPMKGGSPGTRQRTN